jgi:methyl-accepting chemotaxis protein
VRLPVAGRLKTIALTAREKSKMNERMKNCWEILNCGREKGGSKVRELGECIASEEGLGHSCWAIAGTLCGGIVQGTHAQKERNCMSCDVYNLYHRQIGSEGRRISQELPEEQKKYTDMLRDRMRK